MNGKCPKCDRMVSRVNLQALDVYDQGQPRWIGLAYLCPSCAAILSVQIDPVALRTETIRGVVEALKKQ